MAINANDKYYTPKYLVEKTINKTLEIITLENITEFIEPSAGDGAFISELEKLNKPFKCYDILPEHKKVVKQDFLKLDIPYKKGRVVIGNPPFGTQGVLYRRFLKKSTEIADYIAFILPVSQFENTASVKKMKLIYSENLGAVEYYGKNDVKVKTCLNIYKVGEYSNSSDNELLKNEVKIRHIAKAREGFKEADYNFDFYVVNLGSALNIDKKPRLCSYYGVKVLNETNRKNIARLLFSLKEKYFEQVKDLSVAIPRFNKSYLQKIIKAEIQKDDSFFKNYDKAKLSSIILLNLSTILALSNNEKVQIFNEVTILEIKSFLDRIFYLKVSISTGLIHEAICCNRNSCEETYNIPANSGFI